VNLAPGDYRLAVSLVKDTKTAGFNNEVVYSYSGLTSAFTRTFTDEHFAGAEPDPDPETGSLGLTISFGAETILLSESGPLSFEEGAATTFTLAVTGAGFSDINWYLDEDTNPVASGAAYTPANDLEVKIHSVTVRAEKGGKPYSEIVDFTVTAAAGSAQQTVGPVSATGLAGALASLTTDATPEAPHTVILAGFDVTGSAWGGTVKAALTGNTKYIILDLTACTTSGNNYTLSGGSSPTGNHFNIIRGYNVVGVILPSDLTEIGNNALNRWTSLRYVTITSNLITIGGNSFAETTSLKTITIPNSVTTIVGGAFQDGGLESIAIPDSVTSLEAGTFSPCPDLTEVTFGGTGMTIENDTFEGNLHTVYTGAGTYAKTSGTGSGSVWAKD
jgi:hypothetical protein